MAKESDISLSCALEIPEANVGRFRVCLFTLFCFVLSFCSRTSKKLSVGELLIGPYSCDLVCLFSCIYVVYS